MANDFRHRLKRNPKPYRSSCSHITSHNGGTITTVDTTDNHHPQYSLSFNSKLHPVSISISHNAAANQDSPETPVCSDNEDSDDDDHDDDYNISSRDHNQWYMAFPDDTSMATSTKYINTQSAPDITDDDMEHETELFSAKTLYPIRFQRHLHQLYSEGDGGNGSIHYNNKSVMNEGGIMTMMGGTDNGSLYSEGNITMDTDEEMDINDNMKEGITLMGDIQTNNMDYMDYMDPDQDILIKQSNINITLMGHYDITLMGEREENAKSINGLNVGITLMGNGEREDVTFIVYSMH